MGTVNAIAAAVAEPDCNLIPGQRCAGMHCVACEGAGKVICPGVPAQARYRGASGMPKGPKGEKRPADVIGGAIRVARIATGEETEDVAPERSAAAELGSKGGKAPPRPSAKRSDQKLPRRPLPRGGKGTSDPFSYPRER